MDRDLTKDFIRCRCRAWWGGVAEAGSAGAASRGSTSLDKERTRLRKGLEEEEEEEREAPLEGEEEVEEVVAAFEARGGGDLSEGQDELVGGLEEELK